MLSVIIPAYNEAESIVGTVQRVRATLETAGVVHEIIVVDDGSTDGTGERADAENVRLIRHPSNAGYGRALKSGIAEARFDWCAITDADGSYPIESLPALLEHIPHFDMVVGARTGTHYWGSVYKRWARMALLALVRFVVGTRIPDVNSGFRVFRKSLVLAHSQRISSGFSFTTTLTLAMLLDERFVHYVPIEYHARVGTSKVRIRKDSLRTLQILVQAILFYNPLKLFLVVSLGCAAAGLLIGLALALASPSTGMLFFGFSLFVAAIVGAIGLLSESLRLRAPQRRDDS